MNPTQSEQGAEQVFREGYKEGYSNGSSDCANYNCGAGSKHEASLKRDEDQAWEQSDAKSALSQRPTPATAGELVDWETHYKDKFGVLHERKSGKPAHASDWQCPECGMDKSVGHHKNCKAAHASEG